MAKKKFVRHGYSYKGRTARLIRGFKRVKVGLSKSGRSQLARQIKAERSKHGSRSTRRTYSD